LAQRSIDLAENGVSPQEMSHVENVRGLLGDSSRFKFVEIRTKVIRECLLCLPVLE
jgi:hypothetical protein